MCGRYVSAKSASELRARFDAVDETGGQLSADFNVAPTKPVPAVLVARDPDSDGEEARQLRLLRWGLVPFWAKDPKVGSRMINARVETVAEKPAYRRAFLSRRCLLPPTAGTSGCPRRSPAGASSRCTCPAPTGSPSPWPGCGRGGPAPPGSGSPAAWC